MERRCEVGMERRERWRGVSEFEFVEVGLGSKKVEEIAPTSPIIKDDDDEKSPRSSLEGRLSLDDEKSPRPSEDRLLLGSPQASAKGPVQTDLVPATEPQSVVETVGRASIESTRSLESRTSRLSLDDPGEREKRAKDEKELLEGKAPSLIVSESRNVTKECF